MESEILQTLQEIRGVLYIIAAIFFVGFSVIAINSFVARMNVNKLLKKSWKDEAIEYFESGNIEALMTHCKARQMSHKNDSNSYYWQARAYREEGKFEKAKEYFAIYSKMTPENHEAWVLPYLDNE